jgi:hypothetical protein
MRRAEGRDVFYAWGYGGQMLYVVPDLALTVVMTSDETKPSASTGHRDRLNALLAEIVAAVAGRPDASLNRSPSPASATGDAASRPEEPAAAPRG